MPLEPTVTNIADLNPAWPAPADSKSDGDDHIRNLKKAMLNDFVGFAGAVVVTGADGGAANAYTLTPANALPAYGLRMAVVLSPTVTNTGAATLAISGLAAVPIVSVAGDALKAGDLVAGRFYVALYDGASFRLNAITKSYVDQLAFSAALPGQAGKAGKVLRTDGAAAAWGEVGTAGAAIASAATLNLDAATGDFVHVTGTTAITAITLAAGAERTVVFDGSLTLTNGAALILPGGANITTQPGDSMRVRGDAASARVVGYALASGQALVAPPSAPVLSINHEAASTGGGLASTANTVQTRTLNTVKLNEIAGASLSANTVTLPAGTYEVSARCPSAGAYGHQAWLYNTTDSTVVVLGSSAVSDSASITQSDSILSGKFTISAQKSFQLRHWTEAASTAGLGRTSSTVGASATNSGQVSIYAQVILKKVA